MDCEKVTHFEESYLIGELEESEMKWVKSHLDTCDACQQRLNQHEELLGQMFGAIRPVTPPGPIKLAVLNRAAVLRPPAAPVRSRKFGKPRFGYVYAGLVTILLLVIVVWQIFLFGQIQALQVQSSQANQLLDFSTSPDTITWAMTPPGQPDKTNGPIAEMFARNNSDFYYVTALRLPLVTPPTVYRLWYTEAGQPAKFAGELQPDAQGKASLKVADPTHIAVHVKSCFITQEAADKPNQQPNSSPFLEWVASRNKGE